MIRAPADMWGPNALRLLVEAMGSKEALKVLGVPKQTLTGWLNETRPVPRCAVLALYWESALGRSLIDSDHFNELSTLRSLVAAIQDENARLRERVRALSAGWHGSANDVFFDDLPRPPTPKSVRAWGSN